MSLKVLMDDGNQINIGTGIGKYSLYLYKALKKQGLDIELVENKAKSKGSRAFQRLQYILMINSKKYLKTISEKYDIAFYTNYLVPFRRAKGTKYIVTIHDMVAFLYPETLPRFYRYYNRISIRNSIKNADMIMTVSESVKKEILSFFPNAEKKLHYTWEGLYDGIRILNECSPYENEKLSGIDEAPFFLFVSTVEKRKNVGMVIEAFIELKKINPSAKDYKLVIVGRPGFGYEDFVSIVNESGCSSDVIFSGYTSDEDCNRLYNHAKAFVFPTIYEGFGFAQIECMKCHLPIILSDISTNREISRDYGLFFNLNDITSLVRQMGVIVNNEYDYAKFNELADEYVKDFSWDDIAKQYIDYMEKVVVEK